MRRMLVASKTTPLAMRRFKDEDWVYLQAIVSKPWEDGGASVAMAKKHGYSFEKARGDYSGKEFSKSWIKRVKQSKAQKEKDLVPFQTIMRT
jgi:hypothetical protein